MQTEDIRKLMPLYKIVAAAMVDTYSDISYAGVQQMFQFWAVRGYQKLANEVLKNNIIKATITVNRNTNTATLPLGFEEEIFVGIINSHNQKVPLKLRSSIVDTKGIEDIPCEDKCPKCNCNKSICKDLEITEDTVLVVINGQSYEKTVIKKLYPDGRYFLETKTPVLNIETDTVEYSIQKEVVANLSLKPCGCIEETEENLSIIQTCCPDVYCSYFAPCSNISLDAGYRIFEETGLIQFDSKFKFDKVYLEYRGSLIKKNGQYYVPSICYETLVNFVKFKSVENKSSVSLSVRNWYWDRYRIERDNMEKIMGRLSLENILYAVSLLPKFDFHYSIEESCCPVSVPTAIESSSACEASTTTAPGSSSSGQTYLPVEYAGIVGLGNAPVDDTSSYQNDKFKNAVGLNEIHIDNTIYSRIKGEFTLDATAGTISIYPNKFFTGSSLVVPTFFKIL